MQPTSTPSLLDWLKVQFGQPRHQRLFRFGVALLVALWGGYGFLTHGGRDLGSFFILIVSALLFIWALSARDSAVPAAGDAPTGAMAGPGMPGLALGVPVDLAERRASLTRWLAAWRLPSALLLAIIAQAVLIYNPPAYRLGLGLYLIGVASFAGTLFYDRLLGTPRAEAPAAAEVRLEFRRSLLAVAALAGLWAFVAAGGNQFRPSGVLAWIVSVAAWLAAVWETERTPAEWWAVVRARAAALARSEPINLWLSRGVMLFLLVLLVGAYFRFAQLDALPPEMTSDHVEKLFDVNDVLTGARPIFFERNTGREPLQFYFAVLVIKLLGTGVTHLTLKITSAVAGFLMLPFVYLLGRELEDEALGLLAMLLAGISFWATAISRVGLRFPLSPLFVAPTLYYLLRGVRRGSRNDFLLAGLWMGIGLYGYSPIRVLPVLVAIAVVWFVLWSPGGAARRQLLGNTVLLFTTTFLVFLPLYRYATSDGNLFWYRSVTRLTEAEQAIRGSAIQIFLQNNWNALRVFNWLGDDVWVNTIPNLPLLDAVTGALFVCGLVFLVARLLLREDKVAGLLLVAIPILLLPSTLSIAYPDENPSAVRIAGAMPIVMVAAAYPAWLLLKTMAQAWPTPGGRRVSVFATAALLAVAALVNNHLYFNRYPAQYLGSAQNASEIGVAVRGYANSIGSMDRVYMCLHPHWADTRAVGIYAGQVGWEQVLPAAEFGTLVGDPRPLMVVVNPRSEECRAALRSFFPSGRFSLYHSQRGSEKDFLLYFVPGEPGSSADTLIQ